MGLSMLPLLQTVHEPGAKMHRRSLLIGSVATVAASEAFAQDRGDSLPSWNGAVRASILDFVRKVTTSGSPDFVAVPERIAVFDNDGTLWSEQPVYFQLAFALDRVKALAPQHPEWREKEPYKSLLEGDVKGALAGGERSILDIIMTTHAGMTTDEFSKLVTDW